MAAARAGTVSATDPVPAGDAASGAPSAGLWRRAEDVELTPILASALDAFYESGYHGTSVRDIARRTGLTVPALYYHHENKEAILAALLDNSISSVLARTTAALAEAGDDPVRRFDYFVECLALYMAHNAKSAAMDAEIRALTPENRKNYSSKRRVVERTLAAIIAEGVGQGVFAVTSPAETARALLGMIQAIAVWYRPGGKLAPPAIAAHYVDIAAHTVGIQR